MLLAASSAPAAALAQVTVQGRVTEDTGRPLAGAQVFVEGTTVGSVTNDSGAYRLVIATPRTPSTILVRFIGYKPSRVPLTATSGAVTQDFALTRDVLQLDEVVTTGSRVATERSQLGATISAVNADAITNSGAAQIDVALGGKVPGALVQQTSGTPGGGTSVRIRGLSTLSRSAEPLYIVDGVIVDNSSTQLIDLGGYSSNRLSDLDPNDIDRIEIVKGAAAAALYGSRANDGVVQIFTKRGANGALRTTFRSSVGSDAVEHRLQVNRSPVNLAGQPVTRYDYQDQIFRTARTYNTSVALSGGDERTQFYLSGALQDQEGVIRANDYRRENVRLNLDRTLTTWLRLSASTSYIRSNSNLTPNGGLIANQGVLTNFLFNSNDRNLFPDPVTGQYPLGQSVSNPLDVIANWRAPQQIDRYIGGLQLAATPLAGLTLNYRFGYDTYTENASQFVPRNSSALALATGSAISATDRARLLNSDLDASYAFDASRALRLTTSGGLNYQQQRFDIVTARAEELVPGIQTVQGSRQFSTESVDERRTLGFYGQEQAAIADVLFLTAALRSDAASAFGATERTQYFPKFGASLDVSGLGFWRGTAARVVNRLRLRSALGFSGGQPAGSFDRFSNYVFEPSGDRSGVVNSTQQGNQGLKPERQRELEVGADAEFFGGRFGTEVTYFDKRISDLILPKTVRPSSGFSSQLANVGELRNKGWELLVRSLNVRRSAFMWTTTATLTTNDPKVAKLSDGGAFFIPESFGIIRVAVDTAPGHFFGTTYVRDAAGHILDSKGAPIQDASGKIVGIPAIGPRKFIGNPNPHAFWSVSNDFTLRSDLGFRVQVDGVSGVDAFNFDRRLLETPAFGVGKEYERELRGDVPRGYFQARRSIFQEYIEDGSFVKLREVSLNYTLRPAVLRRVGVRSATVSLAGRNLKTWTNYTGWDPETNAGGQRTLVRGFSFATTPIPRNASLGLTLNF